MGIVTVVCWRRVAKEAQTLRKARGVGAETRHVEESDDDIVEGWVERLVSEV